MKYTVIEKSIVTRTFRVDSAVSSGEAIDKVRQLKGKLLDTRSMTKIKAVPVAGESFKHLFDEGKLAPVRTVYPFPYHPYESAGGKAIEPPFPFQVFGTDKVTVSDQVPKGKIIMTSLSKVPKGKIVMENFTPGYAPGQQCGQMYPDYFNQELTKEAEDRLNNMTLPELVEFFTPASAGAMEHAMAMERAMKFTIDKLMKPKDPSDSLAEHMQKQMDEAVKSTDDMVNKASEDPPPDQPAPKNTWVHTAEMVEGLRQREKQMLDDSVGVPDAIREKLAKSLQPAAEVPPVKGLCERMAEIKQEREERKAFASSNLAQHLQETTPKGATSETTTCRSPGMPIWQLINMLKSAPPSARIEFKEKGFAIYTPDKHVS